MKKVGGGDRGKRMIQSGCNRLRAGGGLGVQIFIFFPLIYSSLVKTGAHPRDENLWYGN